MQSKEETVKNLINCGTCGYPLTSEERTTLVEKDGVMVKPAPVQEPALVIYQGEIAKSNLPKGFTGMLYTTPPAQPAPVQEPVGYITQARCFVHLHECTEAEAKLYGWKAISITPPAAQRQWVGLTDEERYELLDKAYNPESYAVLIEAKLKEKNT